MFDFLTGLIDIFLGIFEAIQKLVEGVIGICQWIFGIIQWVWGYFVVMVALIPTDLYIVIYPLLALCIAAAVLKAISWIKNMIPFN